MERGYGSVAWLHEIRNIFFFMKTHGKEADCRSCVGADISGLTMIVGSTLHGFRRSIFNTMNDAMPNSKTNSLSFSI